MYDVKAPVSGVWQRWAVRRDADACVARYRADAVNRQTHRSARALLIEALCWRIRYETRVNKYERKRRRELVKRLGDDVPIGEASPTS